MPKSVLRAVLGRMQFILHATRRTPNGASRLVQAMSAWLRKTRRAPSRRSKDARVYGHTITATHKLSTPPPPLPPVSGTTHFQPLPYILVILSTTRSVRMAIHVPTLHMGRFPRRIYLTKSRRFDSACPPSSGEKKNGSANHLIKG